MSLTDESLSSLTPELEGETYFGLHMSEAELDAEFLTRMEAKRLRDLAAFNEMAWFGYRFMHPGRRVFLFTHHYKKAYLKTAKLLGKKFSRPPFMRANPFETTKKADITGLITATFTADSFGIPYDIWCESIMERSLRSEIARPLQPVHMYGDRVVGQAVDAWKDRNERGIYLARAEQYLARNYAGHPWQDAYQDWLCDRVVDKGNRAFWLGRLIYTVGHLRPEAAEARFDAEVVAEAVRYK